MFTDLRLQHFRSYTDNSFTFDPGVNIIVGPNASGKTNLIEALLLLAVGKSYRAHDGELIEFSEPWARLDGKLSHSTQRTIKLTQEPIVSKTYELDGKPYKRLSLTHTLPVVLFEPNHLQLLTGSPEQRRNYLDDLLEQTVIGYGTIRRHYRRALAQRNSLLKQPNAHYTQLFPWNVRLSELAGQIVRARTDLVATIGLSLSELYHELSHTKTMVRAHYMAQWPSSSYESNLLKKLETNIEHDKIRGFTSAGPHREDLLLTYDDHPASETASRGETRTGVLALKIIELTIIEAAREQAPFLLLDDVFSELDAVRRQALTSKLSQYQTFITTTDADMILEYLHSTSNIIRIQQRDQNK